MNDRSPASQPQKNVTKRLRFEIFRRDGFRCRYCGATADETAEGLTVDHVRPVALGGDNSPDNLVTACKDCNAGKSSSSPDEHHIADVAQDAVRWAAAIQEAARLRQEILNVGDAEASAFADEWNRLNPGRVPDDWESSVRRFAENSLNVDDIIRMIGVAARNRATDPFAYFCGCCWKEIGLRQDMARAAIAAEAGLTDALEVDLGTPGDGERELTGLEQVGMVMAEWGHPPALATAVDAAMVEAGYLKDRTYGATSGWYGVDPAGAPFRIDDEIEGTAYGCAFGFGRDLLEVPT